MKNIVEMFCDWQSKKKAVKELRSLPDELLIDIGIRRCEIESSVYGDSCHQQHDKKDAA